MSLETRLRDGFIAVATEINNLSSDLGSLTSLSTTDKTSLVAALNEVKVIAESAGGDSINDTVTNTSASWSGQKVSDFVSAQITALVDGAPGAMDTLNELATAITSNDGDITGILTSLSNRVRVDTATQGLTALQKTNARTNIDAASATDVGNTDRDFAADFTGALT